MPWSQSLTFLPVLLVSDEGHEFTTRSTKTLEWLPFRQAGSGAYHTAVFRTTGASLTDVHRFCLEACSKDACCDGFILNRNIFSGGGPSTAGSLCCLTCLKPGRYRTQTPALPESSALFLLSLFLYDHSDTWKFSLGLITDFTFPILLLQGFGFYGAFFNGFIVHCGFRPGFCLRFSLGLSVIWDGFPCVSGVFQAPSCAACSVTRTSSCAATWTGTQMGRRMAGSLAGQRSSTVKSSPSVWEGKTSPSVSTACCSTLD